METVKLDYKGLIPAIIQNAETKEVIMLGYMNQLALGKTMDQREVWFYSRSRSELWHKGETSGNYMHVESISVDCDLDVVLIQVVPDGPGCHTGNTTCFFTKLENTPDFKLSDNGSGILDELFDVIKDRKRSLPEDSYTTELFIKGIDQIGQKVIEEAGETVIAGVKKDNEAMVREAADLLYHLLVMLAENGASPEDIYAHLCDRRK